MLFRVRSAHHVWTEKLHPILCRGCICYVMQPFRRNMCFLWEREQHCNSVDCSDQAAGLCAAEPGSVVWNSFSVTEAEIWALWTCLLVEHRILHRSVRLHFLETWLTVRDSASVPVSVRNQLCCVTVFPLCVCVWEGEGYGTSFKLKHKAGYWNWEST